MRLTVVHVPFGSLQLAVIAVLTSPELFTACHPFIRIAKVGTHVHLPIIEPNLPQERAERARKESQWWSLGTHVVLSIVVSVSMSH